MSRSTSEVPTTPENQTLMTADGLSGLNHLRDCELSETEGRRHRPDAGPNQINRQLSILLTSSSKHSHLTLFPQHRSHREGEAPPECPTLNFLRVLCDFQWERIKNKQRKSKSDSYCKKMISCCRRMRSYPIIRKWGVNGIMMISETRL